MYCIVCYVVNYVVFVGCQLCKGLCAMNCVMFSSLIIILSIDSHKSFTFGWGSLHGFSGCSVPAHELVFPHIS